MALPKWRLCQDDEQNSSHAVANATPVERMQPWWVCTESWKTVANIAVEHCCLYSSGDVDLAVKSQRCNCQLMCTILINIDNVNWVKKEMSHYSIKLSAADIKTQVTCSLYVRVFLETDKQCLTNIDD